MTELLPAFERWEALIQEFELTQGVQIPEMIKTQALKQMVPEEAEKDINRSKDIDTFNDVKDYVMKQVTQRLEPFFEEIPKKLASLEEAQQDGVELCEETFGISNGHCNTCGGWGHRQVQCPTKDELMRESECCNGKDGGTKAIPTGGSKGGYKGAGGGGWWNASSWKADGK